MRDAHGRTINYIRLSVTDRCNLRCTYCMAEDMQFLPRRDLLTFEEIETLCAHLVTRVRRIRLTGGEPLVRKGIVDLVQRIAALSAHGLEEVTLTTNGTRLPEMANDLADAGIRRVNISLDTLDRARFDELTRRDEFDRVVAGIDAALAAGIAVRINTVAMKGINDREMVDLLAWSGRRGCDLALIEAMPLGEVSLDRQSTHLPLDAVAGISNARSRWSPRSIGRAARHAIRRRRDADAPGADNAAHRELLRWLQSHPHCRNRDCLWLPRARPEGRTARCHTWRGRGGARYRARHAAGRQAATARFRHRSPRACSDAA